MSVKTILPAPSPRYDPIWESSIKAAIERAIDAKLGNMDVPQYPGIPCIGAHGSNATFNIPTGAVYTTLPFDTEWFASTMFGGAIAAGLVTCTYAMNIEQVVNLYHPPSGVTVDVQVEIGTFKNGVLLRSNFFRVPYNSDVTIAYPDLIPNLLANDTLQLKARHDNAGNFQINMINSSWLLNRLSVNPKLAIARG